MSLEFSRSGQIYDSVEITTISDGQSGHSAKPLPPDPHSLSSFRMEFEPLPNLEHRDPLAINRSLKTQFRDIFAEPEPSIHSFDWVWLTSFTVYSKTKLWCYRLLTALLAVPLALVWGITYACFSCSYIWCCAPGLHLCALQMRTFARLYALMINCACLPYFNALGYVFNRIRVTMAQGSPPDEMAMYETV